MSKKPKNAEELEEIIDKAVRNAYKELTGEKNGEMAKK